MAQREQPIEGRTSYELVTVIMRYIDCEHLRRRSLPMDEHVSLALARYVKQACDDAGSNGVQNALLSRGCLRTIRCALPKGLCNQVRALKGRFDLHALEAVRLYLL
jgi:hypothetical protein